MALMAAAGMLAGCGQPRELTDRAKSPFAASQDVQICYRHEMINGGLTSIGSIGTLGPDGQTSDRIVDRTYTLACTWFQVSLSAQSQIGTEAKAPVTVTAEMVSATGGGWGHSGKEPLAWEVPPMAGPDQPSRAPKGSKIHDRESLGLDKTKKLQFRYVISPTEGITAFDANAEHLDRMLDGVKDHPDGEQQAEHMIRTYSYGGFAAVADVLAYLPPKDSSAGDTWLVKREKVYPYDGFSFSMLAYAAYSGERSTCRVVAVRDTPDGQIMEVSINGRRIPYAKPNVPSPRIREIKLRGRMHYNFDTAAVELLELTRNIVFSKDEDMRVQIRQVIRATPTD
jgi:hypothetical protein